MLKNSLVLTRDAEERLFWQSNIGARLAQEGLFQEGEDWLKTAVKETEMWATEAKARIPTREDIDRLMEGEEYERIMEECGEDDLGQFERAQAEERERQEEWDEYQREVKDPSVRATMAIEEKRQQLLSVTMLHLGLVLSAQKRYTEAETCLKSAIREAESLPADGSNFRVDAFHALGDILIRQGKYTEAEASLRRAARRADTMTDAKTCYRVFSLLGDALLCQQEFREAEKCLRRAAWEADRLTDCVLRKDAFSALASVLGMKHALDADPLSPDFKECEAWRRRADQEAEKMTDAP